MTDLAPLTDIQNWRRRNAPLPQSLATEAYDRIRRRIISCDLEPGRRFTESELADEHGFGKTPVREALRRLIMEGLVEVLPRQGHRVAPIRLQDVHEIFGMRLILEPAAAELAIGRVDTQRMRELDREYMAVFESDPVAAFPLNTAIHLACAHASGNMRLARSMLQVLDEAARLYIVGFRFRSPCPKPMHEHIEIIEALESNDPAAVREAIVVQVLEAKQMAIDALLHSPDLLDADVTITPATRPAARSV